MQRFLSSVLLLSCSLAPAQQSASSVKVHILGDSFVNVLPGSTVDLYGTIAGGKSNAGTWTVEDASAGKSSGGTSFTRTDSGNSALRTSIVVGFDGRIDACPYSGSSTFDPNWMKAASYLTVKLTSMETPSVSDTKRILICDDPSKHKMHIVPNYKTLYADQPWDTKAVLWGMVEQGMVWKIVSQPTAGDGHLLSTNTADTVFSATRGRPVRCPGLLHVISCAIRL